MSLRNLNDLIKKYEEIRRQIDSIESRRMYGPFSVINDLRIIDEFIKDLKEVNKNVVHKPK